MAERRMETTGLPVAVDAAMLVLLLVAPTHSALGQDDLPAAEAAAKAGAETADGKKFAEALGQAFGREHGGTIRRCMKEVKRPDLSDFDLFLRVDGSSVVEQAFVKPTTTLTTCVVGKMRDWKTSVPPHAGFWVKVGVIIKRK